MFDYCVLLELLQHHHITLSDDAVNVYTLQQDLINENVEKYLTFL